MIATTTAYAFGGGTVSNTALALTDAPFSFTAAQLQRANRARVTCAAQPVRYRYDGGSAPDANIGHYLAVNEETELVGHQNISQFKVIRATGSDGSVMVTLEE